MSRLDSFIRRLEAQRACLDRAALLIGDIDGFGEFLFFTVRKGAD